MSVIDRKIRILFLQPSFAPFIKKDLEILKKHFDVRAVYYPTYKNPVPLSKLIKGILQADIVFSWFASWRAFLAVLISKICEKKTIVVVGGWEVAKVSEIGYGGMLRPRSSFYVKFVLRQADIVSAVSKFTQKQILTNIGRNDVKVMYNGINHTKFKPAERKENLVITVASYVIDPVLKTKGIETFINAAKYLPQTKFVLIGSCAYDLIEYLKSIASSNVEFVGFVPNEKLVSWYQGAKVYCQLSRHESFGMALAEAMSCECIPVVTNNGSLPEVVGSTGFYVPYGDPKATADAIEKALNSNKGKAARERIKKYFTIEQREKALTKTVKEIVQKA